MLEARASQDATQNVVTEAIVTLVVTLAYVQCNTTTQQGDEMGGGHSAKMQPS